MTTIMYDREGDAPLIIHPGAMADWNSAKPQEILSRTGFLTNKANVFSSSGGGMSKILCFSMDGRSYALKYSELGKRFEQMFTEEVENQYRTAAVTRTPNIYYARMGDKASAMIMDYVPGPTMDRYSGNMVKALHDLALEMHKMHQTEVIHRDIKPANVIMSEDGPSIIDFGISIRHDGEHKDPEGGVRGTMAYIAPETLLEGTSSPQSDQYNFGSLCSEVLTGKTPFAGEVDPIELMTLLNHIQPDVKKEALAKNEHPDISNIVDRCLQRDPNKRYSSMLDVARELERYTE